MVNRKNRIGTARRLTESALMIAFATVLSLVKLISLPAGGSVTAASMVPIILIAYRYGAAWGLFTGLVHGSLQLLLDPGVFSFVTGWKAAVAVVLLDYIFAFALIGLAGIWRRLLGNSRGAVAAGGLTACLCRYLCHVFSGATVWAGLSVPSEEALLYSFSYNATYMLPETIITLVVLFYLTESLDFSSPSLVRHGADAPAGRGRVLTFAAGAALVLAVVYDTLAVFSRLQAEDGTFDITRLSFSDLTWPAVVTAAALLLAAVLLLLGRRMRRK